MKRVWIASAIVYVAACGPSYGGQGVKTPEELLAEQERLAEEDERRRQERGSSIDVGDTDMEKTEKFDKKHAKMELKRATRSAETCPEVVASREGEDKPRGATRVTITFQEDGTVKDATIPSPFDDTPVGNCVLRAYRAVKVPPYTGGDQIVDWELTLENPEASAAK